MNKNNKFKWKTLLIILIILGMLIFLYWQNNDIVVRKIEYTNEKIPADFKGFKLLQISDLHNKQFGKEQKNIIKLIEKEKPDAIIITGDIIDANRTDSDIALELIKGIIKIAPIYYVTGNHESEAREYRELAAEMTKLGVVVMGNNIEKIIRNESSIYICGIDDLGFIDRNIGLNNMKNEFKDRLTLLGIENKENFQILLSHRPEFFDYYQEAGFDLVFSGHAHGGQIRIPLIGGLIAPGQGIFPRYTTGPYYQKQSALIVSRGLGNSKFPFRIFNRPELVTVEFD